MAVPLNVCDRMVGSPYEKAYIFLFCASSVDRLCHTFAAGGQKRACCCDCIQISMLHLSLSSLYRPVALFYRNVEFLFLVKIILVFTFGSLNNLHLVMKFCNDWSTYVRPGRGRQC